MDEVTKIDTAQNTNFGIDSDKNKSDSSNNLASLSNLNNKQFNPVIYPNGEVLNRPLFIPRNMRLPLLIIVFCALIIAGIFYSNFLNSTIRNSINDQESLQVELNKDIPLDLPILTQFIPLTDEQITDTLTKEGQNIFVANNADETTAYKVYKLPSDMSQIDAAALYASGIDKLSASEAAKLLHGSWELEIDRTKGVLDISLHYADFSSHDVRKSIDNALASEGLNNGGNIDSGDDDGFGNAFSTGTFKASNKEYSWTVAAIPLESVYSIAGMPEEIIYVGIRIKAMTY